MPAVHGVRGNDRKRCCRRPNLLLIDLRRRALADIVGVTSVIESDATERPRHSATWNRGSIRRTDHGMYAGVPPQEWRAPTVSDEAGDLAAIIVGHH
jgi:hypothetical protein